jgi:hypothetical protein
MDRQPFFLPRSRNLAPSGVASLSRSCCAAEAIIAGSSAYCGALVNRSLKQDQQSVNKMHAVVPCSSHCYYFIGNCSVCGAMMYILCVLLLGLLLYQIVYWLQHLHIFVLFCIDSILLLHHMCKLMRQLSFTAFSV